MPSAVIANVFDSIVVFNYSEDRNIMFRPLLGTESEIEVGDSCTFIKTIGFYKRKNKIHIYGRCIERDNKVIDIFKFSRAQFYKNNRIVLDLTMPQLFALIQLYFSFDDSSNH